MGFQTGSQIRPELANADFSGFTNAAKITADRQANLDQNITEMMGAGIEKYTKNKEDEKVFAQQVKSSLALTDALMENLSPEQADKLARAATESGVNDGRLSMRERAQAAQQFGASLDAIVDSIKGPGEVTSQQVPGGTAVMQDGEIVKVITDDAINFGGTPTTQTPTVDSQPLTPEEQAYLSELRSRQ